MIGWASVAWLSVTDLFRVVASDERARDGPAGVVHLPAEVEALEGGAYAQSKGRARQCGLPTLET